MPSTQARVAHVWRRLGFGPTPGDVEAGVAAGGPAAVIDDLLARPSTALSDWNWPSNGKADWDEFNMWISRLFELWTTGPSQVQERGSWMLTGLLVTAWTDAVQYQDLKDHQNRLRAWPSSPSYKALLGDVAESKAMQKYLTNVFSVPPHANENLARELMELFSLGVTHPLTGAANYTESDIKEIARALTGYRMDWTTSETFFDATYWDTGTKTFLGASRGAAKLPDVINAVTSQDSFRYFVPRRVYRDLVGVDPSASTLQELANVWGSDGDLRGLIAHIARRPEFVADATIGNRVKSPVELLVSAARVLGFRDWDPMSVNWLSLMLNQNPTAAPDVSGWDGRWLHPTQLIVWSKFAYWLAWADDGTDGVAADSRNPTVRRLFAEATPTTGGDMALAFAGLYDVSSETRQAVNDYASGGAWSYARACATMNLVIECPEFMVS